MAMFDFLTVGKALKNIAADLASIRFEAETLAREVEDLQFAPAHPDDVLKALGVWAADNAAEYRDHLKKVLNRITLKPAVLAEKGEVKNLLRWNGLLPEPSAGNSLSRDVQMCGLLGPETFVELVKKQMQAIAGPAPGLPMADRAIAVADLEKKIRQLRTREADLIRSAEKAGLAIS